MKTNLSFSFVATSMLLLLVSCNSDNDAGNDPAGNAPKVTFTAGYMSDASSRTGVQRDGTILWYPGDAINVNGQQSTSTVISEAGKTASFVAEATPSYYAFYPASMVTAFDAASHTFTINLPATQSYKNTVSFSDNVNPAVAKSENTYLIFHNVCGMLRVPINTNVVASKARFLSLDQPVSGAAIVDPAAEGAAGALTMTGSGKTVDIVSLKPLMQDTLMWVLPVGKYCAGWRIQLLDATDNVLAERVFHEELSIECAHINNLKPEIVFRTGILSAGLYWAKGNLYNTTAGGTYNFASAQEIFINNSSGGFYYCYNTQNSQVLSSDGSGDPCALVLPLGSWRTPTDVELTALGQYGSVWTTKNSIAGRYYGTTTIPAAGTEDNYVFLPAAGYRESGDINVSRPSELGVYRTSGVSKERNFTETTDLIKVSTGTGYGGCIRCVSGL